MQREIGRCPGGRSASTAFDSQALVAFTTNKENTTNSQLNASRRFGGGARWVSLRSHFVFTSVTSSLLRFHSGFISIAPRFHFGFTSMSLGCHGTKWRPKSHARTKRNDFPIAVGLLEFRRSHSPQPQMYYNSICPGLWWAKGQPMEPYGLLPFWNQRGPRAKGLEPNGARPREPKYQLGAPKDAQLDFKKRAGNTTGEPKGQGERKPRKPKSQMRLCIY
jgi:hypothetical protein